jgi:hypothetical protein
MLTRRMALSGLACVPFSFGVARSQTIIDSTPPLPQPSLFEAGDLLWPKKPGVFVPYNQRVGTDVESDRQIWEREKNDFLKRAANGETSLTREQIAEITSLDYREFVARYNGDQKKNEPGVYSSGGGLYVGHVALIDFNSAGQPIVIEALWGKGVVRSTYKEWIEGRPGEVVWLGRLRDHPKSDRAAISAVAATFIGRPYNFWDFNLNDDSGFYCSKLVWLSIFRRLGFAVDGDPNPRRGFWFSPKQLLNLPTIQKLHDPGPYATR